MSEVKFDPSVKKAGLLSIVVAGSLFSIKFFAFHLTGSQAIFSEAMESIVNVLAAALAFYVLYYASKPADKDHPYGHGKVEYLSAAVEGGLIAFAAFMILVEAIKSLSTDRALVELSTGTVLLASTGVINLLVGFYLQKVGKRKYSEALLASGKHLIADFWTTAGVLVGLTLVIITGLKWLDSAIAILVSLHLIKEGYELIRKAVGGLLDEENHEVINQIRDVINKNHQDGIIQVHHLRVMRSGKYHHIDAHVVVPEFWSVEVAHDETLKYEKKIFNNYEFDGEIHFHIDPCRRLYCQFCSQPNCPVRKEPFEQYRNMSVDELTDKDEPEEIVKHD